jgi:predicted SAM-dependent methyltransferase
MQELAMDLGLIDKSLEARAPKRLNIGCGDFPLLYYTNIDEDPSVRADLHIGVPPLPYEDESIEEIYAGHFLEHLEPEQADFFLAECFRCLVPGGLLGLVVPDMYEVMRRYTLGLRDQVEHPPGVWHKVWDLDDVCRLFVYNTVSNSRHRWCYDLRTLKRILEQHGFRVVREIDRYHDPRIPVGAWYQCGWDAQKPIGA